MISHTDSSASALPAQRLPGLDALRGLAALAVMIGHYSGRLIDYYPDTTPVTWQMETGQKPVWLFFIISGFVISMTLERVTQPMQFVRARFLRLYPAFFVAVLLTFSVVSLSSLTKFQVSWTQMLFNLTMIPEFLKTPQYPMAYVDGSYWSLQSEFFFYITMFGILLTKKRLRLEWLMVLLLLFSSINGWFWNQNNNFL